MAHEFVRFRQGHKLFHMTELEVTAALIAQWELERIDIVDARLRQLLEGWLDDLRTTTAFFDMRLDDYILTESDKRRFVSMLNATSAKLAALGTEVPANLLNEILRLEGLGAFEKSFPADSVRDTIEQIRQLVLSEP